MTGHVHGWYTHSDSANYRTGTVRMLIQCYILAQPGEYDWTVRVRRRYGLVKLLWSLVTDYYYCLVSTISSLSLICLLSALKYRSSVIYCVGVGYSSMLSYFPAYCNLWIICISRTACRRSWSISHLTVLMMKMQDVKNWKCRTCDQLPTK